MSDTNSKRSLNNSDTSEDEWVGPKHTENNQEQHVETQPSVESELEIQAKKREIKKRKSYLFF